MTMGAQDHVGHCFRELGNCYRKVMCLAVAPIAGGTVVTEQAADYVTKPGLNNRTEIVAMTKLQAGRYQVFPGRYIIYCPAIRCTEQVPDMGLVFIDLPADHRHQ